MSIKIFLCIAMGVFVAHIGVLMLLSHLRPKPPAPPKPTFTVRSQTVMDRDTGEKLVYREITVSTRFTGKPPPATPAAMTNDQAPMTKK